MPWYRYLGSWGDRHAPCITDPVVQMCAKSLNILEKILQQKFEKSLHILAHQIKKLCCYTIINLLLSSKIFLLSFPHFSFRIKSFKMFAPCLVSLLKMKHSRRIIILLIQPKKKHIFQSLWGYSIAKLVELILEQMFSNIIYNRRFKQSL